LPSKAILDELYAPRLIGRDPMNTTADLFREHLAAEPLRRDGAIIEVPDRPGLGLEVDRAVPERYAVTTGEKRR
jgi:L-alanine-DL-glutamate epimerase-like enolase superfamily enzyme